MFRSPSLSMSWVGVGRTFGSRVDQVCGAFGDPPSLKLVFRRGCWVVCGRPPVSPIRVRGSGRRRDDGLASTAGPVACSPAVKHYHRKMPGGGSGTGPRWTFSPWLFTQPPLLHTQSVIHFLCLSHTFSINASYGQVELEPPTHPTPLTSHTRTPPRLNPITSPAC